jgi:hypothetical protein
MPLVVMWKKQSMRLYWCRGGRADKRFARFAFECENMRVSPIVRSKSVSVNLVRRGVVLYVVYEEFPECTVETDGLLELLSYQLTN